jgi:P27 family predicted phage terminase small subunit
MSRGRKPKPTRLKLLQGIPGHRPLPENEAQIAPGMPDPPKHLGAKAKKEWKRITPELYRAGLLTKIDGPALASYCDAYAQWVESSDKLKKTGMLARGAKGDPVINPYLKISNAAQERMKQLLVEFGMTPSSRSRVKAVPLPGPDEDEGIDYFGWTEESRN